MEAKLTKKDDHYFLEIKPDTLNTSQKYTIIANTLDKPKGEILQLSLKNCEAIERGYDLDELVDEEISEFDLEARIVYRRQLRESLANMFQKALELMGDKKFSEDDIYEAFSLGERGDRFELGDLLDSRQKTEWDVEVEMEETGIQLSPDATSIQDSSYAVVTRKPKLDADGCLILRLIIE